MMITKRSGSIPSVFRLLVFELEDDRFAAEYSGKLDITADVLAANASADI